MQTQFNVLIKVKGQGTFGDFCSDFNKEQNKMEPVGKAAKDYLNHPTQADLFHDTLSELCVARYGFDCFEPEKAQQVVAELAKIVDFHFKDHFSVKTQMSKMNKKACAELHILFQKYGERDFPRSPSAPSIGSGTTDVEELKGMMKAQQQEIQELKAMVGSLAELMGKMTTKDADASAQ